MAMPTSAWARAGASLMPSPTMATRLPFRLQAADLRRLLTGAHAGDDAVDADGAPTASALRWLSPVSMRTSRPSSLRRRTASTEPGLIVSAIASTPAGAAVDARRRRAWRRRRPSLGRALRRSRFESSLAAARSRPRE